MSMLTARAGMMMTDQPKHLPASPRQDGAREPLVDNSKKFNRQKRKLRMVYKQWKAGMLRESDLSPRMRQLLSHYYGVRFRRKRS